MTQGSNGLYLSVDGAKCSGHARCAAVSEALFSLDDEGYCNIGSNKPVPAGMEGEARAGVAAFPEQALELHIETCS
jgi:ferredoxin